MGIETGTIDLSMAMVFQEPLLFDLTVEKNIALGLRFRKAKNIKRKVDKWLEKMGIKHLALRRAVTLSSGEAQKAALARAFILEPKTLLLDEPFANLDLPSQIAFREELKRIILEANIKTIWVTHNVDEALLLANHLMIMINRQIVQEGRPCEVLQKPATKEIASFLGIENIYYGEVIGKEGRSFFKNEKICFEVTVPKKDSAWAIVHPEDIILSKQPLAESSARNCLCGIIQEIIPQGLISRLKIMAGELFVVDITRISAEELAVAMGKKVFLTFKATAVQII